MNDYLIFDLGGTSVKYGCSDEHGSFKHTGSFPTPQTGMDDMILQMKEIYLKQKESADFKGIAVSAPGAVDSEAGRIGGISAIPYIHDIPFAAIISSALDNLPVSVENDANCAALGELWAGAAKGMKHVVSVVCGTGIGGAVVIDGRLYKGSTNNGGEFGNYLIRNTGDNYFTWSSFTLVKQAQKYSSKTGKEVDGKTLLQLSSEHDEEAIRLMEEFYETMACGFYNIQFTLDTELIVLGGGVSESPDVLNRINKKMDEMAERNAFGFLKPAIVPCKFGSKANLYGALYHFLNRGELL